MRFNLPLRSDPSFDVVGMGLNSVDFLAVVPQFPAPDSKTRILRYAKEGGGQVATAMVALQRWGLRTKYIGKVGGDDLGRFSQESIGHEGVEISSLKTEPHALNQFAIILVDRMSGERTILWDRDERLMYRDGELRKEAVCSGRFLHLDGHDLPAAIECARWAKEEGVPVMIDLDKVEPRTPELIREIDFVVTSARFPSRFTGVSDRERALVELQKSTAGFVCATLGRDGAMALVDGKIVYAEGFKISAVDTTGAGDVFHAGFIYGLLHNWEVREILRFANAAAALKCRELGGRRGIPQLQEIQRLLEGS
jgi:sulfofructose kinase